MIAIPGEARFLGHPSPGPLPPWAPGWVGSDCCMSVCLGLPLPALLGGIVCFLDPLSFFLVNFFLLLYLIWESCFRKAMSELRPGSLPVSERFLSYPHTWVTVCRILGEECRFLQNLSFRIYCCRWGSWCMTDSSAFVGDLFFLPLFSLFPSGSFLILGLRNFTLLCRVLRFFTSVQYSPFFISGVLLSPPVDA